MRIAFYFTNRIPDDNSKLLALIDSLPFGEAERDRLLTVKNPSALAQSLSARLALYGLACGFDASSLEILREEDGKPYFSDTSLPAFSLSHTVPLAVAVLGNEHEGQIGVDLEIVSPRLAYEKIATRFFDATEQGEFAQSGSTLDGFLRIWTKKEALSKATGIGLARSLEQVGFDNHFFTKTFYLSFGDLRAYLTVCSEHAPERIEFMNDKEIRIDEFSD